MMCAMSAWTAFAVKALGVAVYCKDNSLKRDLESGASKSGVRKSGKTVVDDPPVLDARNWASSFRVLVCSAAILLIVVGKVNFGLGTIIPNQYRKLLTYN